jgi:signal transduction histidine kinase
MTPPECMPQSLAAIEEFNTTGRISSQETQYVRKDGSRWWAMLAGTRTGEGAGVGFVIDLSERRQVEEERKRLIEEMEESRVNLAARVAERTTYLEQANLSLNEEINERRRAEAERTDATRKLVTALEEERRRISRELHDQLGQQLTVLKLHLESLVAERGLASFRDRIERAQTLVQTINKDIDFLAWELRPTALDDLGLAAALGHFVQEWSEHCNIRAQFHATAFNEPRLSRDIETMLYRIAQEALNNVWKHAQASQAEVMLERHGSADNGKGFDTDQVAAKDKRRGMGLLNMRERAAFIGGTLEIESQPGNGTTVYVRVPFVAAEEGASNE